MAISSDGNLAHYMQASSAPATAAPLTIAARVYPTYIGLEQHYVSLNKSTDTVLNSFSLGITAGGNVLALTSSDAGYGFATSSGTMSINNWYHCAAVFVSAASRYAYLNGTISSQDTTSRTPSGINLLDIFRRTSARQPAYCSLAEVGIWNIALATGDILALNCGACPLLVNPASLIFYSRMLGNATTEVDLVGGRTLTGTGVSVSAHPGTVHPWGGAFI